LDGLETLEILETLDKMIEPAGSKVRLVKGVGPGSGILKNVKLKNIYSVTPDKIVVEQVGWVAW
jgi:hypothetical protein